MSRWVSGQVYRWVDLVMDEWQDGSMFGWCDWYMDGRVVCTNGLIDSQISGWINWQVMDGEVDGLTSECQGLWMNARVDRWCVFC